MDEAKRELIRHLLAIAQDAAKNFGFAFLLSSIISLAIIGCRNKDKITINENNIIFAGGKILPYTNKDKPKITFFDNHLEMHDYDVLFIGKGNKNVIMVHETIPYEGIDSFVTIYDERGNIIRKIDYRGGYYEVSPDHSFFIFIDEVSPADFMGNVEFYSSTGELLNRYKFSPTYSVNLAFDKDSQYCVISAISDPCHYIVYKSRTNNILTFILNRNYCAGQLPILIDNDYILIIAEDYRQYYFAILKPDATIIGEKMIARGNVSFELRDMSYDKSAIGFRGKSAKLIDSKGNLFELRFE